jgi:hypothetical protein
VLSKGAVRRAFKGCRASGRNPPTVADFRTIQDGGQSASLRSLPWRLSPGSGDRSGDRRPEAFEQGSAGVPNPIGGFQPERSRALSAIRMVTDLRPPPQGLRIMRRSRHPIARALIGTLVGGWQRRERIVSRCYGSDIPGGIGGNLCRLAVISLTVLMVGGRTPVLSIKSRYPGHLRQRTARSQLASR